jgi:hypothetical protein
MTTISYQGMSLLTPDIRIIKSLNYEKRVKKVSSSFGGVHNIYDGMQSRAAPHFRSSAPPYLYTQPP